ncbi:hypothetical protein EMIHUDRAFT_238854 [Emiliania huxleyi CCMP1516]|uniref:SHOCT domain-containing protein n=2 Tax=Emiliania huxleyi TaxID=2903 RepID=A0A0D3JL26_EMIH1|nr:hypothetical protein EMIHUDRAFT_238854 [Emiliania huxleyi CCMP1516]EOD24211.1 hypothetical protein EMIHUDRAFT_238854 [Emiliania huxleyi CCMP1516]|eukprot:XP_005776640.1 hypothetical protein EMIHUDRAFT_238854 [Emiliania huxleyi CCMP1516]
MVDLARLENLKRLLNDGTLTREEFEALKQKELQADGTERGSDRRNPAMHYVMRDVIHTEWPLKLPE